MPEMKNDKYRRARGGKAFMVWVYCALCESEVLYYQKDGDGALKRCYLNRIYAPAYLERLQSDPAMRDPKRVPALACPHCKTVLGKAVMHHDGRVAFRLRPGLFFKRREVKTT